MTTNKVEIDAFELLTTTRSVRKRLDLTRSVPRELIEECLKVAVQAPNGGNLQGWEYLAIDGAEQKRLVATYYQLSNENYHPHSSSRQQDQSGDGLARLSTSVDYLAEHLHEVPVLLIPLQRGRLSSEWTNHEASSFYGSAFPAIWSFMLAARLQGLGTTFTTMHLRYEREIAEALQIPFERVSQIGLVAVAYYRGDSFKPAKRYVAEDLVRWNQWRS